ncbi:MAG: flavin prenyltransferase UbiX [Sulfuricellaceae bacterium]|nr:flavin prenyltransferase UbiX [Sulfuricellaceae bacterium]
MTPVSTVTLALTGASGMPYAFRLLESLLAANVSVNLLVSQAAQIVAQQEMSLALPSSSKELQVQMRERHSRLPGTLTVYGREEWFAPIASGSNVADAMVVCPCTMGTLAAIATGMSDNLIERAADVTLKEQRKLILVPRETPFSALHLENMLKLARLGALILPANPGFYHHPASVQDLVDFVVARILDHLGISHQLMPPWGSH